MNTPIADFVKKYSLSKAVRLHMPGHKGVGESGAPALDITEIYGADSLYSASSIIGESEKNATALFGTRKTCYGTEGSSQCIKAMLALALIYADITGKSRCVAAARNVHRAFVDAAALLDFGCAFFSEPQSDSLLGVNVSAEDADRLLKSTNACALYVTSPNYLGGMCDIEELSRVCRENSALLLVDNAHGAYLKFLSPSMHPIDLGADICCDSAHKTLPVLTGGAYLHLSEGLPCEMYEQAKPAMALFGSTSPSYLILQSLDLANAALSSGYARKINECAVRVGALRQEISKKFQVFSDEPLKITIFPKSSGYTGDELCDIFRKNGIECEFSDPDALVMMPAPNNTEHDFRLISSVVEKIEKRAAVTKRPPKVPTPPFAMSVRQATMSRKQIIFASQAAGRVLADPCVACPPAVPIAISGQIIDDSCIQAFEYYSVKRISVVHEREE